MPHFSKKGLRKISRFFLYLFFSSLLFPFPIVSAETGLSADALWGEKSIAVDIRLEVVPAEEILESLEKGYRSEIIFNIKVYRKAEGLFAFLGDRLIREAVLSREAGWDMFDRVYYFIEGTGRKRIFKDRENFFAALFSLHHLRLSTDLDTERSYYLLANVQVNPVKLTPPISIIQIVRPEGRFTTPWERVALEPGGVGEE